MASPTYPPCFAWLFFTSIFTVFVSKSNSVSALSVKLYHRDSYGSPFYDPKLSKSDIIRRALTRTFNSSNTITLNNSPMSKISNKESVYFMKIRLGTPSVDVFAVMDTSTDLTWIQCEPCVKRLPQETPLFKPRASSTYYKIQCSYDNPCPDESMSRCESDGFCHYNVRDIDGVYSKGFLSQETMKIDTIVNRDVVEIPHYTFGCGYDNGSPKSTVVSGVIGLGAGPYSLVSQLGSHSMRTFSYCLIPFDSSKKNSHIRFGENTNIVYEGTVSIPLANKHPHNLYHLTLEAFTIGTTRVEFIGPSGSIEEGNIIVDSGTIMTTLPWEFYSKIRKAVMEQVNVRPVSNHLRVIDLCFKKDRRLELPQIVANFRGGDVRLKRSNAYVTMHKLECLAFRGDGTSSVYGNVAQQDFIVGFDKNEGTVSFTDFDCDGF